MKRIFISFFVFVAIVFLVISYAFFPVAEKVVVYYLQPQIADYNRNELKGLFYVIGHDLKQLPEKQWAAHIAALKTHFGFPINLMKVGEIEFTVNEQQQFEKGLIVVGEDGEKFYQQIGNTSGILSIGSVGDFEDIYPWIEPVIYASAIVFLGGFSVLWAFPFWKKLRHISTFAVAFGNGKFNARVNISRRSALAPLADAFNSMADHIQQLISSQKELTNAVSHELRTPIARIRFSMEMLDTATKKQEHHHYISEIKKDIDELDELVAESLTYARFDRNIPIINLKSLKLEFWLMDIANKAMRGHANLYLDTENRLAEKDGMAILDPRFMGRAIDNLIRNASMHAAHRVAVILDQENRDCIVHVDDDGPGVPQADRERIFAPFTRLDTSRNRESGGYGLGLAIVDRVVKWHDGSVSLSDSPLGGARLTIRWPGFSSVDTNPSAVVSSKQ